MRRDVALTVVSLLALTLLTVHMTHDVLGQHVGAVLYPIPVAIFALWLYGTLALSGRIWGYVIMLLGGLFSAGMIVVHSKDFVVGKSGGFFFVWTLFALAATGWVTMLLSIQGIVATIRARRAKSLPEGS